MMLDLTAKASAPLSLFDTVPKHNDGLMLAIDTINARHDRGSVGSGLAGKNQDWRMRRENLSPSFTTNWSDLAKVVME
jgi:DNA polymerase V